MDYEKLHKETINRLQQMVNSGKITVETACDICGDFVPESEDERIMKEILSLIRYTKGRRIGYEPRIHQDKMIDWLEKKDKKKSIDELTQQEAMDIAVAKCFEWDDQKPTDKVEQKFHKGDWVVSPNGVYWHIDTIWNGRYEVTSTDGTCADWPLNTSLYHLWTIQDAKDGDVLVDKSDGTIGIFQSIGHHPDGGMCNDPSYCFLHCRYDDGFFYADFENSNTMDSDDAIPATKEQRDLLFQKMKEASYEWDADKKELKKIDEEVNGEDYGIDSLYHAQRILEKTLGSVNGYQSDDGILEHKAAITAIKKLYKQDPAEWSEEDEKMLENIIKHFIRQLDSSQSTSPVFKDFSEKIDWLKSLKERVQPQDRIDIEVWVTKNKQWILKLNGKVVRGQWGDEPQCIYKQFFNLNELISTDNKKNNVKR